MTHDKAHSLGGTDHSGLLPAANISVGDTADHYVGSDLETILAEIGQSLAVLMGGTVPPTSTPELGVYGQNQEARFESVIEAAGGQLVWHRIYYTTQTPSGMGLITTRCAAGYKPYLSFRSSFTDAQIASGSDDARWTSIGNFLGGIADPFDYDFLGAWCYKHEADRQVSLFGSNANGDAFRAAFNHIAAIIKPLAPLWYASACLTDEVFPSYPYARSANWASTVDVTHWIPSSIDLLGVDYYAYRGGSDSGSHWATQTAWPTAETAIDDFLAHADGLGVPLIFPEFGALIRDPAVAPTDNVGQAAWINGIASGYGSDSRIKGWLYFEVNDIDRPYVDVNNPGKANYSITDPTKPVKSEAVIDAFVAMHGA